MHKTAFPVRPGMKSSAAADIQNVLLLMLEQKLILSQNEVARDESLRVLVEEHSQQTFKEGTKQVIILFQEERHLQMTNQVDEPTANSLTQLLEQLGVLSPEANLSYTVVGSIFSQVSASLVGLRVVVDQGVGGPGQLAETSSAERGAYRVSFLDSAVRQRGKGQPDLQVQVFAGGALVGASDVRYNATRLETLDVKLSAQAVQALRSEHEALTVQYAGRLGDLKETEGQQDITYLANKTGWDARAVALAALADQGVMPRALAGQIPAMVERFHTTCPAPADRSSPDRNLIPQGTAHHVASGRDAADDLRQALRRPPDRSGGPVAGSRRRFWRRGRAAASCRRQTGVPHHQQRAADGQDSCHGRGQYFSDSLKLARRRVK